MSRIARALTCLALVLSAAAGPLYAQTAPATATAPPATKPAELALSDADNGKTLHIAIGRTVTISLAGNATTGYSWSLAKLDGNALEQIGAVEYAPDRAPAGMVGTGGTSSARFRAVKPGQATISLAYARPWEKDTPPAKSFTVTLIVDLAP